MHSTGVREQAGRAYGRIGARRQLGPTPFSWGRTLESIAACGELEFLVDAGEHPDRGESRSLVVPAGIFPSSTTSVAPLTPDAASMQRKASAWPICSGVRCG